MTMRIVLKTIIVISRVDVLKTIIVNSMSIIVNSRRSFVLALMKCSFAAFGEQKQGMNLQQHKQHDSTIIPLATTQLAAGIVLRQLSSIKVSM